MLRILSIEEVATVSGGIMEDSDNFDGGDGGDCGFSDESYGGTTFDLTSSETAPNGDTQIDFSQDQQGDIVVVGERNMPEGWSDSSWVQIGCKTFFTAAGESDFQSDLMCHVDWSGDNPQDPKNAKRLGEIMKSHSDEIFGGVEKVVRGLDSSVALR